MPSVVAVLRAGAVAALLALALPAQRGDKEGEPQPDLPADLVVPEAPPLSPPDELATFRLAAGLRVELVAAEPLVMDPVAVVFDGHGRLWVVEMRGYMPDVDATGEAARVGSIAVLTDRDGDGRMDTRVVFADGLVLPRAVLPVPGGALFVEPPGLWFGRDVDGDLRMDERVELGDGFAAGISNPEHAGNGPLWGLDNWIHFANHPFRYRWRADGTFAKQKAFGGGQWGLAMDDRGRLFFDYNSDWLRLDRFAGHYGVRHPDQGPALGLNQQVVKDQATHPIRVTPGINRGYQKGMLRDGFLLRTTACCGPAIYRGDRLPGMDGDAFVCEPAGNLVRRFVLTEGEHLTTGANPYGQAEFLASTDERFRPVNLQNGPDGALYVVDMYRGLIQHRNFVTTFLRKQVLARGLERPIGMGRIWRIVPADGAARAPWTITGRSPSELVAALGDASGWVRDSAQQALIARGAADVVPALRELARGRGPVLARLHALWTLEGLGALGFGDAFVALRDGEWLIRLAGLRLAEPFAMAGHRGLAHLMGHVGVTDPSAEVAVQAALSLGEVPGARPLPALAAVAAARPGDAAVRAAVASGLHRREVAFLRELVALPAFAADAPAARDWLRSLARLATGGGGLDRQAALDFAGARMQVWQQQALLQGMVDGLPKGERRRGAWRFAALPQALPALQRQQDPAIVPLVQELLAAIELQPEGPAGDEPGLDDAGRALFARGARVYGMNCAACHQPDGRGLPGLAPPLRESEWVLGEAAVPIRIVLHGLSGPIDVLGEHWDLDMPAFGALGDGDLAAVVTYVRNAWGQRAAAVGEAEVAAERWQAGSRNRQWSGPELRGR